MESVELISLVVLLLLGLDWLFRYLREPNYVNHKSKNQVVKELCERSEQ